MLMDYDVDFEINEDFGIGLEFEDEHGSRYETVYDGEYPRIARLRITTYRGALGAVHWYGRIHFNQPWLRILEIGEGDSMSKTNAVGDVLGISGSIDRFKPDSAVIGGFRLTRPLTEVEVATPRFETYSVGDRTQCFGLKETAEDRAVEFFEEVFRGRWVLAREYWDEDEDEEEIIAHAPKTGEKPEKIDPLGDPEPVKQLSPPSRTWPVRPLSAQEPKRKKLSNQEIWDLAPRFEMGVEVKRPRVELPDGTVQGLAVFKTFCTDVTDEDGNDLGSIGGGTGAVVICYYNEDGELESWHIKHDDLWWAFVEARKRWKQEVD